MSASINPYIQRIQEFNKDIEGLKLDRAVLQYELDDYKRYPVETICIDSINEQIQHIDALINQIEIKIIQVSKLLR